MFKNKTLIYGLTLNAIRSLTIAFSVFYMMAYGLSLEQVGFIKAFQAALIFFLDVPLSYLADKISRRFSVLAAGLCSAIWLFLMAGAHNFAQFLLAELFNSFSLLLFSGTFVAYLLDNRNDSFSVEVTLSHYNQYGKMGMALFCLIGSTFATIHSRWTWILAGGAMLICCLWGVIYLPRDHNRITALKRTLKEDLNYLHSHLQSHQGSRLGLIFWQYVIALLLLQVMIQYWQPYAFGTQPTIQYGLAFGIYFSILLAVQAYGAYFFRQGYKHKNLIQGTVFTIILAVSLWASISYNYIGLIISGALLFFIGQLMVLETSAEFHKCIASDLRATMDSIVSSIYRLFLIGILPEVTWLMMKWGWFVFPSFCALGLIVRYFLKLGQIINKPSP